jgi:hypothetical protein
MGTAWLQYEFDSAKDVIGMTIKTYGNGSAFTVQYSDDGTNFSNTSISGEISDSNEHTYLGASVGTHKYWRVNFTNSKNHQVYTCQFHSQVGIAQSSSAMTYIGLNNYASNTLTADSDWLNGIANSAYIDSVLNVKVPTMTSYTTPSGVVSQSSENGANKGWYAFDNDLTKAWYASGRTDGWLQYKFDNPENIKCIKIVPGYGASANRMCPKTMLVMYSDDGNTFTSENTYNIAEPADASDKTWQTFILSTGNLTKQYWRTFFADTYGDSASAIMVWELQFYGREDV